MTSRRYYVHDCAATQATQLATWDHLRPRFLIVDRTTGSPVDDAQSRYAARQAARGWNEGAYDTTTQPEEDTMTDKPDDLLSYEQIAPLAKVSAATLRGYRAAERMPEPDASPTPDRPRWRRDTIETWLRTRPGRGHSARTAATS